MQSLLLWGEVQGGQSSASLCDWWGDKALGMLVKERERGRDWGRKSGRESEVGDKNKDCCFVCQLEHLLTQMQVVKNRMDLYAEWLCREKSNRRVREQLCAIQISQWRNGLIKPFQSPVCNFTLLILFSLVLISMKRSACSNTGAFPFAMQIRPFKCVAKCREQNKTASCDLSYTCTADCVRVCVVLTWQNPVT